MNITMTNLRKITKDLTSSDMDKMVENLLTILNEKRELEAKIKDELESKELIRLEVLDTLQNNNLPIPPELKKPLEIKDFLPKRRKRKRKVVDKVEPITE